MSAFFDLISNNKLISSLTAAAILGLIAWIWRWRKDRRDVNAIYDFLGTSKSQTEFTFRSTEAIASHTGIDEGRVALLCAHHRKRIQRNEKEKQSWRLVE
jgi:hypothetical protein